LPASRINSKPLPAMPKFQVTNARYNKRRKPSDPESKSGGRKGRKKSMARTQNVDGEIWWVDETGSDDNVEPPVESGDPTSAPVDLPIDGANILAVYEDDDFVYELTELNVDLVTDDGALIVEDILVYEDSELNVNMDVEQNDEPVFDECEQYYDEDDNPQYDMSGAESSLGIRG
jgi:hypothetical protein